MQDLLLFVIPIYFQSLDQHKKDYEQRYEKFLNYKKQAYRKLYTKILEENPTRFEFMFQNRWYSWNYTQIVKFVEIRLVDSILKAYLYSAKSKQYGPKMRTKIFDYRSKDADVSDITSSSNKEIRQDIQDYIAELRQENKRYYVDTELIDNLLPLIDFRKIK